MQTRILLERKRFNKTLRLNSHATYERMVLQLCQTHVAYECAGKISAFVSNRDYHALLDYADSLGGQTYTTATEHFVANQFALLIKKYPWPRSVINLDPEAAAVAKFLKSEHFCKRTNQRFRAFYKRSPVESYLAEMRSFIRYVLSDVPNLSEVLDNCGFGPGASIGVHGNATHQAKKILARWSVTPAAFGYVPLAVARHEQLREYLLLRSSRCRYTSDTLDLHRAIVSKVDVVRHNKITFVPKTAKTFRSIAIEPVMNGYLQKGIDVIMRKRLKRIGVDLTDQTWNQRLAKIGSSVDSHDSPVTIDLSAASDSLALEVVRYLLPAEWFDLLNNTRSKQGLLNGVLLSYEKFCSMGNGFCFPLESLIFAAAVKAVGGRLGFDSAVYGDDIIVPKNLSTDLLALLKVLGFRANTDKTFLKGPFRESCGSDWFGGEDVRPFTLDFAIDSIEAVFKVLNLSRRNARTSAFFDTLDLSFFKVPQPLRLVRPFIGNDDTAVTVSQDEFLSSPYSRWCKATFCWSWLELEVSPVCDREISKHSAYSYALVFGALSGIRSAKPFTYRRKTITKLRRKTGSGATSLWLPAHCSEFG